MGSHGRPQASTRAQRERVEQLAKEGLSQRRIAEAVFGDASFRGKVERILRQPKAGAAGEEVRAGDGSQTALEAAFAERSPARRARALLSLLEERVSAGELEITFTSVERWLRLHRQVEALEALERARELARDRA